MNVKKNQIILKNFKKLYICFTKKKKKIVIETLNEIEKLLKFHSTVKYPLSFRGAS